MYRTCTRHIYGRLTMTPLTLQTRQARSGRRAHGGAIAARIYQRLSVALQRALSHCERSYIICDVHPAVCHLCFFPPLPNAIDIRQVQCTYKWPKVQGVVYRTHTNADPARHTHGGFLAMMQTYLRVALAVAGCLCAPAAAFIPRSAARSGGCMPQRCSFPTSSSPVQGRLAAQRGARALHMRSATEQLNIGKALKDFVAISGALHPLPLRPGSLNWHVLC
jgi:hypothetical protein